LLRDLAKHHDVSVCTRQEKEAYIRAKYVERKFVDKYSISSLPPEQEKKIVSKGYEEKRLSISKLGPGDQVRASVQSSGITPLLLWI
jgi:Arf-GAP/coiled-coil/ANK repeat/PH domain-containing protein